MKINICRLEDGPARVKVLDDQGETVKEVDVNAGQEVTLESEGAISTGDVVDAPAPEAPADTGGDQGGGEAPADGGTAEEPAPPAEEPKDTSEIPAGLVPGRIVTFRSAESGTDLSAVVSGTIATIPQAAIDGGGVPELTGPKRVHLTVISPFLDEESRGGTFQVFNVPQAAEGDGAEIANGTWRWPERAEAASEVVTS